MFGTIINIALILTAALALGALSGYFSEKAGIANIAVEAFMIFGAFGYSLLYPALYESMSGWAIIPSLLLAGVLGVVGSSIFAALTINLKSDHIIAGTALNILAPAITMMVVTSTFDKSYINLSVPSDFFKLGDINGTTIVLTIVAAIFIGLSIFINKKTVLGMRIKASGEHPQALASAGVSVYKTRWTALIISGFLGGVAGGIILWRIGNIFNGNMQGFGFIAVAILVLASWKVARVGIFAVGFALLIAFAEAAIGIEWLSFLPKEFVNMIPFILPIVVLAFTSRKSRAPKAVGQIYDESKR